MKQVRIGLVGTGYIGRCHAIAYAQAPTVFPLDAELVLEYLAEITPELAEKKAKEFGFNRFTGDWRDIVQDPNVDVVDICTPNFLHKEIALAAIANGKHVYSEKPLALTAEDAKLMYEAAKKANVKTLVGFNYIKNPTTQLAREIIANGEKNAETVLSKMKELINAEPLAKIDYVEAVDGVTMNPVKEIKENTLVAMAVYIGKTRLIDNFSVK